MPTYNLQTVENKQAFDQHISQFAAAEIETYPWDVAPHARTYAKIVAGRNALHVFMCSYEEEIRAEQTAQNGPIYTDSCLEFYCMPTLLADLYFNIEVNAKGVIFFSVGKQRQDRLLITDEGPEDLGMCALIHPEILGGIGWCIRYDLPFMLIQKYIPQFHPNDRLMMRGNFYKCGNGLSQPHWGMWSSVNTPKPDFHRPEYFGDMIQV